MGLGKPQRRAKIEVAGFIYYENIREFVKFGMNQNGETPYCLEKLILPLDSQTHCFLFDVQLLLELQLQQMGDFYEKPHFTMENF